jgi:hypothetical protein
VVAGCEHCLAEEVSEFGRIHLARCHLELSMTNLAVASGMSVDDDIVRRVCDHKIGFCAFHKALIAGCN